MASLMRKVANVTCIILLCSRTSSAIPQQAQSSTEAPDGVEEYHVLWTGGSKQERDCTRQTRCRKCYSAVCCCMTHLDGGGGGNIDEAEELVWGTMT
eukprot:5116592-Amphidinium_carterae.1